MTLVTLLGVAAVFAAAGWTDPGARAAVLTVGTIVAVAASKAGDISQDLKTGYLVGATPAYQQVGQLIGAGVACWAVAGAVMLLGNAYEFGSADVHRAAGDAHEDGHRGGPGGRPAVGTGADRERAIRRSDVVRRVGAGICDRRLLAVRLHGAALRRRLRACSVERSASAESRQSDPGILAASAWSPARRCPAC